VRVLQFSTHTTLRPRHGGQLRSHHIGRVLQDSGFDLQRLSIGFRPPDHEDDLREPLIDVARTSYWSDPRWASALDCMSVVGDYVSNAAVLHAPDVLAECDAYIAQARPDAILLEHPWTWPIIARLPDIAAGRVPVIYSSQNVEAALKSRIARDKGTPIPADVLEAILALEKDLVRSAAAVAVCTDADGREFAAWGARRVVVVPNGGVRRRRDHLRGVLPLPLQPAQRYALVVGSQHPPNVSGFMELAVPALVRVRPHHRIVVAGRMGPAVLDEMERAGLSRLAPSRLVVLGEVDQVTLDAAIANAHVLLLPILYGGGSNVKTAEALLSGSPVVASATAMRGFDGFEDVPGLTMAGDESASFSAAILAALDADSSAMAADHPALESLLWDSTVLPLARLLREIGASADARTGAPPAPLETAEPAP
jgi:glycosyltransferase involved in cell wall biosynthesis